MSYERSLGNRPPNWVGTVWKKYSHRIYKLCLQKCATKDDADDLFQEVALRFCKNAHELNNRVHVYGWLETVLLHCHYTDYRKKYKDRVVPFSSLCEKQVSYDDEKIHSFTVPDDKISTEAIMCEFSLLLGELDPLEKMIVELSVVGGLNIRDLSRLIGLSKGNIVSRRMTAFEKMREKMSMQREQLKLVMGRDATLREIIECAS